LRALVAMVLAPGNPLTLSKSLHRSYYMI
jgi:hypothetical protein